MCSHIGRYYFLVRTLGYWLAWSEPQCAPAGWKEVSAWDES